MSPSPQIHSIREATLTVSASDSRENYADYRCDGTADDVEIQAAINALPASGGKVVLLEGSYLLSNHILLVSNMIFEGQGKATYIKLADGINRHGIIIDGNAAAKENIRITNLQLDANGGTMTGGDADYGAIAGNNLFGIWLTYDCKNITVDNCYVHDAKDLGICFFGGTAADHCEDINFNNNYAYNNGRDGIVGDNYAERVSMVSNHVYGNAEIGMGVAFDCKDVLIANNVVSDNTLKGLVVGNPGDAGNKRISFIGNIVTGTHEKGFDCQTGNTDLMVIGNLIYDTSIYGMEIGMPGSIIGGNIVDTGSTGIYLNTAADNSQVIGNKVRNMSSIGILSQGDDALIKGNYVDTITGTNGIQATTPRVRNIIEGNLVTNCALAGISVSAVYSQILGNSCVSNTLYGIRVEGDDVSVIGNIALDNGSDQIEIKNCARILVTGNRTTRIKLTNGDDCMILDNFVIGVQGIYLDGNSSGNFIRGNRGMSIFDGGANNTLHEQHSNLFMDVLAVSATHIRANEDLSAGITITFTIDAQPDVPRTLSFHFDSHAQITAFEIELIGVNSKGDTVTETFDEGDGWDFESSWAYATVTSIKMTARTGTGAGDTMDIGITDVLGLSNVIYATSDVYKIKKNNANAVVAVAQVDTTYDTYDMSVIGLGAADDFTIWYRSNLNVVA